MLKDSILYKRLPALWLLLIMACYSEKVQSQNSSNDTIRPHDPRKAALYSAILPGLGQGYNQKYWKIGVVYGALGGLGGFFYVSNSNMNRYQDALLLRLDGDPNTVDTEFPLLSDGAVRGRRDFYRRNRDISILGLVAVYALQIIDANVDAHLREFKLNKDLSLRWGPAIIPYGDVHYLPSQGIQLSVHF